LIASKLTDPNVHVADVGTGTGIFLSKLAETVPASATLHGFDISEAQFPKSAQNSHNIGLSVADAKIGFPPEHKGIYDIVHLRLLSPGMASDTDWSRVVENVMSLLKPGGALQWSEESSAEKLVLLNEIPGGDPELSMLLHQVWDIISNHFRSKGLSNPFSYFGSVDLVSILESAGASSVRYEVTEFTKCPSLRTPWTINVIKCMRGVVQSIAMELGEQSLGFDVEKLFDTMVRLALDGRSYLRSDIHTHIAFKASVEPMASTLFVKAKL
jgi:SAM-dependent methyltransferase